MRLLATTCKRKRSPSSWHAACVEVSALADREEWVVTWRDNGVGVEPEHAGRAFGRFSRVNGETEGTGIGRLSVSRHDLGRARRADHAFVG